MNQKFHYETTAVEIMRDSDGQIDIFVAGIGTGGTISGIGKYLKEKNPNIQIIGVEPAESAVITGGIAGKHKIQGIGAGFIPANLNQEYVDEVVVVKGDDAITSAKELALHYGVLAGISSGAAFHVARQLSKTTNKRIVVLLPDTGERYLSTELFNQTS